ncbi:hypothetical protein [Sphingomonas sp.]|jgi:hypothetical protein|uniref:hypothetical protein n=1 Tax=Sphingomonas sp. TaxID=28214 RepID=UPI002E304BC0|nr:hypothetical protein [Sphingomonas sp.]HEX4694445.1 hypothetical protein [Sphingomonas sp.]
MPTETNVPRDREDHSPVLDDVGVGTTWPDLRYGDLENLLVELSGGDKRSVLGRFRNLRQMPFPDAIRTGMGNRVGYNLPRVLALCSVFELNALFIPQSHAVAIVQDIWPELVRGFISAAVELGLAVRPEQMPHGLSATVSIIPDGFASAGQPSATASLLTMEAIVEPDEEATAIRLDCAGLMALMAPTITAASRDPDEAAHAFAELNRNFGWSQRAIPQRASVAELLGGSNFLDQGPYLGRADAFLRLAASLIKARDDEAQPRRRSRTAAQRLLDYLGRPAPIDEWKGEIGTEEGRPRVKHQLAAIGELAGLNVTTKWPDVILTASASPLEDASQTIASALKSEGAARAAWIEKARVSAAANATSNRGKSK